ncbi:MAG: Asp-tRNA(Asn)/Glu-tRNA(Gln) amidotransferase subunit GatA [Bacteroidetes bacterium]|nr:Asp-tRNA(Asn)/Glu-tRNA(Gln) amidotransferase subunit GatA [Bacteroidota bacterium]
MRPIYSNHKEKLSKLISGELSLIDNVSYFLKNIEKNNHLNTFNFVFEKEALKQAEIIQDKIKNGTNGKLAGMVIGIKDVLSIKDKPTTCSSNTLKNFNAIYTATAVQKLIDEDAIIIGKTNCDEFAMGSSNENSAFGTVLNPNDNTRVAGGSSGGSAAAVSAGLCDAALGTDTGGSIRQPASFCGVYGLKPTYGRVSRYGLTAFASSFDSIGPFANSVNDLSIILEVISGKDEKDSTSSDKSVPAFSSLSEKEKTIKIGIAKEYFGEGLDEEIDVSIKDVIQKLESFKINFKEVTMPHTKYTISTYYILTTAEASSNLARYDGTRFGHRTKEYRSLIDMYEKTRSEGFGKEVKRRIMLGTYVLSAGYYDAYYRKAQKVRRLIKDDFDKVFEKVDLILTPTTPTTAFLIGAKIDDPLTMYLNDIYTTSANLAGIPCINIPIGKDKKGLPIGMQLLANQFEEEKLLSTAQLINNII